MSRSVTFDIELGYIPPEEHRNLLNELVVHTTSQGAALRTPTTSKVPLTTNEAYSNGVNIDINHAFTLLRRGFLKDHTRGEVLEAWWEGIA